MTSDRTNVKLKSKTKWESVVACVVGWPTSAQSAAQAKATGSARMFQLRVTMLLVASVVALIGPRNATALPVSKAVEEALRAELDRNMADLKFDDLSGPYFVQYTVEDGITHTLVASYGGLTADTTRRSRTFRSRVRVGSFVLDNTNVGFGGGRTSLPLDEDVAAIRQVIWLVTDLDYKQGVEILARKKAYLRDKNMEDRPDDFTPYQAVAHEEPGAAVLFDRSLWRARIKHLSNVFKEHPLIQNASVSLFAGEENTYLLNSEGSRLRTGDTGVLLDIGAEVQADDGMRLSDSLSYLAYQPADLPSIESIIADIGAMCDKLVAVSKAPILEDYTGPVLIDASASGSAFEALLGSGLAARPQLLGTSGSRETSLEKKLGRRILPRSFQVYDDPRPEFFNKVLLAGNYTYDDEAVPAERVDLVEQGILTHLLAGRAPTKKVKHTTGHARGGQGGQPKAHIGCLYISDSAGMSADQLVQELRDAADDEGLEFGLRVTKMGRGRDTRMGPPIYAYKVNVKDGSEEMIRGLSFLPTPTRTLKRILAAGTEPELFNVALPISESVISPAVLFDELELRKIQEEFDKPPILPSPLIRED